MAFNIENNLVAGLRYTGATQTILAQFGIVGVVRVGPGNYLVTVQEGLGPNEGTSACACEAPDNANAIINHLQVDAVTHRLIVASPPANGGADTIVSFKLYRAHTLGD